MGKTVFSEPGEPPDSSVQYKKTKLLEPEIRMGSFLISENVEIITDFSHCFELWQEFSQNKSLFDTWNFRLAFYNGYKYKPYFLLLKNGVEKLALLPLWYEDANWDNKDKKRYTWFGSDWQEEVRFFAKKPDYIPTLLSLAPSPLYLNAIAEDSINPIKEKVRFEKDEPKYILNLEGMKSHEDYLATLKKNARHNLRKDRRKIERQNPEIIINNFADFEALVELSKKRFDGEADWKDSRRIETFRQVINLADGSNDSPACEGRSQKNYKIRMISIRISERIAGVDLVALFNDRYYAVKCGYDVENFPGIGNFFNLFEIDDAIKLGFKKIDFLQNNYQWKDRYFEATPLFKYEK
jgi:hypothetical protein